MRNVAGKYAPNSTQPKATRIDPYKRSDKTSADSQLSYGHALATAAAGKLRWRTIGNFPVVELCE